MTKVRSRGGARVDYTDFLSPAVKALPKRGGGGGGRGGGGKRKASDDDAEEEEELEEETVVVKKKPRKQAPKQKKHVGEEEAEEEVEVAMKQLKPKAKKATKISNAKRRTKEEDGEEHDNEKRQLQRVEEPVRKPKTKSKRDGETTSVVVSKARRYEEEVVVRTSSSSSSSGNGAPLGEASEDMLALRKKYDALREFRELETARLLQEAKALAKEEKRTYDKLVAKLKDEVATLLTRAQRVDADHKTRQEELRADHTQRVATLQSDRDDARETNERLRRRVRELEAGSKHPAGRTASITDAARAGDVGVELSQAKKLLELYRLVTSTELRLIETMDADDEEPDNCTDVACAVVDSVSGKRFVFDLAIPHDASEEVEYVPSDKPSRDVKTPSYLQEELSFKRSELTKFMRTALDVVIRKKKTAAETASTR